MKQQITERQLEELSEKGERKLYYWQADQDDQYANFGAYADSMNIGQMIQFLYENRKTTGNLEVYITTATFGKYKPNNWRVALVRGSDKIGDGNFHTSKELCDCLWEAVKEILEK